jgi:hypothetical protein
MRLKKVAGRALLVALFVFGVIPMTEAAIQTTVLDDFEQLTDWTTASSDGATVSISQDVGKHGLALRVDFDMPKEGGYVIVRKPVELTLPDNYAFTFQLKGDGPRNNVEFKLVDPSGKSVWWRRQRDVAFPLDWQPIVVRKARITLAWGSPSTPKKIGAIEFAISSVNGGKGTFWIDDFEFEEREPASQYGKTAKVQASSAMPGYEPEHVLDENPKTGWRSRPGDAQWLIVDFVRQRDYGGLRIDWDSVDYATAYRVETSDDAQTWTTAWVVANGKGRRDWIYMPDAESRYVRISLERSSRGQGYGITKVAIQPLEFSDTPNQFFDALAADSTTGSYPKYFYKRQTYWTVVGVDGDEKNGLLNEEGMLEVEKGGFSIEPFLYVDGRLIDWSQVRTTQSLDEGYLPIPSVRWQGNGIALVVTAFGAGEPGSSVLDAIYRVESDRTEPVRATLFLAIRPFQVNPPWQSLNMVGGVAPIHAVRFDAGAVWVNRDKPVVLPDPPQFFGATSIEQGSLIDFLREGKVPPERGTTDRFGFASAALGYDLVVAPSGSSEVVVSVPFHPGDVYTPPSAEASKDVRDRLEETRRHWKARLGHVGIEVPLEGERMARTLKSTLAYILINRDGPRLHPGSRNYARSWIRDGALTSATLLQMGFTQEPREFLKWYAQYQMPDGKIPCCVDQHGADPVAENDSNGEFVFAVAEVYRYTRDIGFLTEMWPRVVRAIEYLDALRQQRRTDAYKSGAKQLYYGLLPQSISHEGYASKPVHSYWDDFFALRAFKDAAMLAVAMGDDEHEKSFRDIRDTFGADLYASIARAIEEHKIDYIPGSAELGDYDPSSTAIALDPAGEEASLPQKPLRRTFDKYFDMFQRRRDGLDEWDAFSPYELRIADALVRLGRRDQAIAVLDWMVANQRPTGWNEWQEIVFRDATAPNFIGDMPHTWAASSMVRALCTMLAYEREQDGALVLAAGVPRSWVTEGRKIRLSRLPTHFGVLNYSLESMSPDPQRLQLSGDLRLPRGKIVLRPPLDRPLAAVRVNGKPVETFTADEVTIGEIPAEVELESAPGPAPTATSSPLPGPTPAKPTAIPKG